MRRFLVMLMLCLLPVQIAWATVANYCAHEPSSASQHFGHHDDEHAVASTLPDADLPGGQSDAAHDHCHLAGFLGVLGTYVLTSGHATQSVPHGAQPFYPTLTPDQPERPKWTAPA